jgi:amidase
VFGRVLNPHKLSLTAGGSSGGEGALVAMRGSILGVGTDIGGSIRIPALCCGTYGFKPSASRIPYGGQQGPGKDGAPGIKAAAGPLATTFRDLEYFTNLVLSQSPWNYDSAVMAVPWRSTTAKEKLVIGVQVDEPIHPLYPPVARALSSAVEKLKAAGHSIIFLKDAPTAAEARTLASHFFSLDNTKKWLQNVNASGEPLVPSVKATTDMVDAKPDGYTLEELYDLNVERAHYIDKWNTVWVENKLDVIIGAGNQNTAPPHDTYGQAPFTTIWNLVDVSFFEKV